MFSIDPSPAKTDVVGRAGLLHLAHQTDVNGNARLWRVGTLRTDLQRLDAPGPLLTALQEQGKTGKLMNVRTIGLDMTATRYARAPVDDDTMVPVGTDVPAYPTIVLGKVAQYPPHELRNVHLTRGLLPLGALLGAGMHDLGNTLRIAPKRRTEPTESRSRKRRKKDSFIDDEAEASDSSSDEDSDDAVDDFVAGSDSSDESVAPDTSEDDFGAPAAPTVPAMFACFANRIFLYEADDGPITLGDGTVVEQPDHLYVVDGKTGYISSTTLIKPFFEQFDADRIASATVHGANWMQRPEFEDAMRYAVSQMDVDPANKGPLDLFADGTFTWAECCNLLTNVTDLFAAARPHWKKFMLDQYARAAPRGTYVHKLIEDYYAQKRTMYELKQEGPELVQFARWQREWLEPRGWKPLCSELKIAHFDLKICGAIDQLYIDREGRVHMVDWKTMKQLRTAGFRGRTATGVLAPLPDCNWSKYQMQAFIYKRILAVESKVELASMQLAVFHPNQGDEFVVHEIPFSDEMERYVDALFAYRAATMDQNLTDPSAPNVATV